ncbi:MAG TPA: SH3 domain-containing protein [Rhizomicrobium sp.]|nr:SH3 domain-containing protein [Rhizomicrobium sp.]
MAHRGTASTKKAEAVAPAFASVTAADIIRAPVVQKAIPLDLAALLVPYKRHGRLTLRVERMPQRAKLSAGRNNGDGSWSLASDELEDLNYLVPSSLCGGHELSVRIVSFDNATAHTLKVIPLAIPSWDNDADGPPAENVVRTLAETHDPILHNELSKMQSLFAVRDSDLAELRAALKQANAQKEAELAAARASWEAQLTQRLADAAALAKAENERERLSWQIAQQGQAAHTEALIREQIAQEVGRAKAEADQLLEAERRHWQAQAEQRVAEEHSRLKAQTDQQFEAERKHWQALAEQRVAEERIESGQQLDAERKHWQILTEQKVAEEHIRGKAEADQRVEAERQRWQAQAHDSGAAERHRLLTEADARLAAEQKRWQDQAEQRIAAERQRWQSESDQRLEAERQRWANDSLAAASQAEARWKSEETVRASAALAEWQQQTARLLAVESDKGRKLEAALAAALTAAPAQPASVLMADTGGPEIERLRQELAALQNVLPERDREIAQLRDALNQQRARQESEAAQAAAAQVWKSEEAARVQVANARAESQDAIAAATARAENAERMLAEAQGAPAAEVPRWDDGYVDGLRRDISTLRAALVNREVELGHARAALDQARVQQVVQRPGNAPIRRFAGPDDQEEASSGAKPTFVRDFFIMAGILVPMILGYPYLAGYLPDGVRAGIATATGGLLSVRMEPAPAPRPVPPPAPVVPRPTATVARTANVRDTPTAKGAVLVTLPRDAVVIVLQTSGNWTQVEVPARGSKPQQGWMFNTYLKSAALPAKPANARAAVKPAVAVVKPEPARATVEPERASVAVKPENAATTVKSENTSAAVEPESTAAEPAK